MSQLDEIHSRLKNTRQRLEFARNNLKQVLEDRIGGPDGSYRYHQAVKQENEALRDFALAVHQYHNCVLEERHATSGSAKCPECERLLAVLKTENQVLTQIHQEEMAAAIKNDVQAFDVLMPHLKRVRLRRDAAAKALKIHMRRHTG